MRVLLIAGFCILNAYGQSTNSPQTYQDQIRANPSDSLAHYLLGDLYLQGKNYRSATNEFREALNGNLEPKWIEVWSHLNLARIFELIGQHDRTVDEYRQAAATADNTFNAQDLVHRFFQRGRGDPPRLGPAAFVTSIAPGGPQPVQSVESEYSEEARAAGLEGTVIVRVVVDPDGTPRNPRVESMFGLGLDEKAVDAVLKSRVNALSDQPTTAAVAVNFLLPSKLSRWHLVGASFHVPEGVSRPVFLTEPYPLGAGISERAIDEGAVIAVRRPATVALEFDVDPSGVPTNFEVVAASAPVWGPEAIALVRNWRFKPGSKNGQPVSVACMVDLVWGQKVWTPELLAQMRMSYSPPLATPDRSPIVGPESAAARIMSIHEIESTTPRNPYSDVVSILLGEDGVPSNLQLLRRLGQQFDEVAIEAVRNSHFPPKLLNGKPMPMSTFIEVDFQ